jgi:hypothetical protein
MRHKWRIMGVAGDQAGLVDGCQAGKEAWAAARFLA